MRLTDRSPLSIRIRTGRGGRTFIDRRAFHARRGGDPRNPPPGYPKLFSSVLSSDDRYWSHTPEGRPIRIQSENDGEGSRPGVREEYVRKINEQWRYDDDSVVADEEPRVLIDDFDSRSEFAHIFLGLGTYVRFPDTFRRACLCLASRS